LADARQLLARAELTGTSALAISTAGRPVIVWHDDAGDRPIQTMGITKMVVGVVVGAAARTLGPSFVDAPVSEWLTEWERDDRGKITLRHLLTHTSGLRSVAPPLIAQMPRPVSSALDLPLDSPVGERWTYNNLAFNLVGEAMRRATGMPLHELADKELFGPLRFGEWDWQTDSAGATRCHFGFACRGVDLIKIGVLLLKGGMSGGAEVVPRWWVDLTPARVGRHGIATHIQHAWVRATITPELVEEWREAGIDEDLIGPIEHLKHKVMDLDELENAISAALGRREIALANATLSHGLRRFIPDVGHAVGYGHDGDLGQWLIVMPDRDAVAVRLREQRRKGSIWSSFPGEAWEVAA
jgi:CubicO group peptidase (beta-lactamase class C family)